jgi:hypothetical protein
MNNFSGSLAISFDVCDGRISSESVRSTGGGVERVMCGVYLFRFAGAADTTQLGRLLLTFRPDCEAVDISIKSGCFAIAFYQNSDFVVQSDFMWKSFGETAPSEESEFCRVVGESLIEAGAVLTDPGHVDLYFGQPPGLLS